MDDESFRVAYNAYQAEYMRRRRAKQKATCLIQAFARARLQEPHSRPLPAAGARVPFLPDQVGPARGRARIA
jgi:hypothetical protein